MATKKQRRRREKLFRHDWEYYEVDAETGEERAVAPAELKTEKPVRERPAVQKRQQARRGGRREPQPPSWRRVIKRTGMFAPLMALFIYWTTSTGKHHASIAAVLLNTVILIAFFAPFSYLVDSMTYRIFQKRLAKPQK